MGHDKLNFECKRIKRPYCPFKKFCIFLRDENPVAALGQRYYLSKRVDELEFAMDIANRQYRELLARNQELEGKNTHLAKEFSQALQAPFKKYEKREAPENSKKCGAPVGHPGWFRKKPDHIDITTDVYLYPFSLEKLLPLKNSCFFCRLILSFISTMTSFS